MSTAMCRTVWCPCPPRAKTIWRSRQGGDKLPSDRLLQVAGTGDLGQRASCEGRFGSYLAGPLTSGGVLLSGVKLKKEDRKLTLGFEGRLAPRKQPYSAATSNARL
jgi:hypothetical protein